MAFRLFTLAFLVVVQCLVTSSTAVYSQSQKRGIAGNSDLRANAMNSRWHYRWHYLDPSGTYNNSQWAPMIFGAGTDESLNGRIDYILERQNRIQHVLGFNEPERADQGNTTVDRAMEAWRIISDRFSSTDLQLVSPAVSDNMEGREWLAEFMQRADAENLTIDAVAFHWYGTVNPANPIASANSFLNRVDSYHETYQRPIWITEFAGHDWDDQYSVETMRQANATFLTHALAGLESRSYVQRYAWFHGNNREEGYLSEADPHGLLRPTIVGKAYIPNQVLLSGESLDLNGTSQALDYYYLQGGSISNTGAALVNESVGGIYAMSKDDGTLQASTLAGSSDWGLPAGAFVRVEENATLRKAGTNTISWHASRLYNDGLVRLMGGTANQGTLWISDATEAAGTGQFRLDGGSHLKLGQASSATEFTLPYAMQLRGGKVSAEGQAALLSGGLTLYETTQVEVTGELGHLRITGNFIANPGGRATGIRKTGLGLLTLGGANTFTGNVRVQEGKVAIDGTTQAASVLVDAGATLQGVGTIESGIQASGIVAPGNSIGTLTADSISLLEGSILSIEIGSSTSYDQLVVNGEVLVDPGATLQILLTDDFQPIIGDEFAILTFGSFSGEFFNFDVPELPSGRWDFSQLGSSGIVFVAIPEPQHAAFGFVLVVLLFLSFAMRRRVTTMSCLISEGSRLNRLLVTEQAARN